MALASLLAVLPVAALRRVSDPSPWLHLKVGRFLLDGHQFAMPDPWSPLATRPYIPTQWLPSMATAWLYDHFGLGAVAWERSAGVTLLAMVLLIWCSTLARAWVAGVACALGLAASWPSLTERPQLAGFVLLVPAVAAWWRSAEDHRARWWLIPLTWLAACTHGIWLMGIVVGALVLGSLGIRRRLNLGEALRLAGLLAACLASAGMTPIGPRLLMTPFSVSSNGRQFVQEWYPSSIRTPSVMVALAMLAAVWLLWVTGQRRPPLWQLSMFAAAFGFTLVMQRTVPVGAILATALLATAWEGRLAQTGALPEDTTKGAPRGLRLWVGGAILGVLLAVPVAASKGEHAEGVPATLSGQLRSLPSGSRILADGDITGWVLFTAPRLRPVFDIRVESYSPEYVRRYVSALHAERGWEQFVSETGSTVALLPADSPLAEALREQFGWKSLGADGGRVLLKAS